MEVSMPRSVHEIVSSVENLDEGFCNSGKIHRAEEARQDAIDELMEQGMSQTEAEQIIRDAAD